MPQPKKPTKIKYAVDWRIEGSFTVEASSAEEAQALFDKAWESDRLKPEDGEIMNETPYPLED